MSTNVNRKCNEHLVSRSRHAKCIPHEKRLRNRAACIAAKHSQCISYLRDFTGVHLTKCLQTLQYEAFVCDNRLAVVCLSILPLS